MNNKKCTPVAYSQFKSAQQQTGVVPVFGQPYYKTMSEPQGCFFLHKLFNKQTIFLTTSLDDPAAVGY